MLLTKVIVLFQDEVVLDLKLSDLTALMECLCCSSKSLDTRLVNGRNHIANMGTIRSQVTVYLIPRSLSITILCRKVRFRQFGGVEYVCLIFSSR